MVDKIPEGYKKTEVGVIPQEWKIINLGETSLLKARIGWQGLTTKEYLNSGEYFLITGTDFVDSYIKWETCHYVSKERYNQDKNIQVRNKDVLVTKDGTIGKIAYIEDMTKPATLNSGVFVVRPKNEDYIPKFLYYIFTSRYFEKFLKQLTAGSTINHLYQKDFVKFDFICPPSVEQESIAIVLSDIDELISSLTKLIDKKKNINQGAMQELLTGKKRLSGFSGNWEVKTVGDLCDVKGGKRLPKGRELLDYNTGYPYIRVTDMYIGGVKLANIKYVPADIADSISNYKIYSTDLFISVAGTLGIIGSIPEELNNSNLTENANRLCNFKCNKYFLMYVLMSNRIQTIIQGTSTVGAQPKLALTRIREFEVYTPPTIEEQTTIAQILSDMDDEIEKLNQKLIKYKSIKQAMMQELLTGKRRLI